jgi:hypothetical protein
VKAVVVVVAQKRHQRAGFSGGRVETCRGHTGLTGAAKRFPSDGATRAARKLEYVDLATSLEDLKVPPGNRLHA